MPKKTHPISWKKNLQKNIVVLQYVCYYLYFPGESHQIWHLNCIHTATLFIKIIVSFSTKNYVSSEKKRWACICSIYWIYLTDHVLAAISLTHTKTHVWDKVTALSCLSLMQTSSCFMHWSSTHILNITTVLSRCWTIAWNKWPWTCV